MGQASGGQSPRYRLATHPLASRLVTYYAAFLLPLFLVIAQYTTLPANGLARMNAQLIGQRMDLGLLVKLAKRM